MIHYHGGPLGKSAQSHEFFSGRHSLISFQHQQEMEVMAEVSHSFILDNGAFSVWKSGQTLDVPGYYQWIDKWRFHPGFDWCLIPDVIEGSEEVTANDILAYNSIKEITDEAAESMKEELKTLKELPEENEEKT